jgi:hypothetical protein
MTFTYEDFYTLWLVFVALFLIKDFKDIYLYDKYYKWEYTACFAITHSVLTLIRFLP